MNVSYDANQLSTYLQKATDVSPDHPVVISKFVSGAKEIEFDGVANNGKLLNYAISEHVENAGVHSGDATLILPAQNLYTETTKRIKRISKKIAEALCITGPFNIQFLCKDNCIKVIECNLRASRSFPFVSKCFNVNFIELATKAMLINNNDKVKAVNFNIFDMDFVCVKSPMFSFTRLDGADPVLRVEMASTGEVACFGDNKYEAFIKAIISSGYKLPIPNPAISTIPNNLRLDYIYNDIQILQEKYIIDNNNNSSPSPPSNIIDIHKEKVKNKINIKGPFRQNILISIGPQKAKYSFVDQLSLLKQMGFNIYATENTHYFYNTHNLETTLINKPSQSQTQKGPNAIKLIEQGLIHFVLCIPGNKNKTNTDRTDGYQIRRKSIDFNVPLISNIKLAKLFVTSLAKKYLKSYEFAFEDDFLHIKSWKEYMQSANRY